jgi:hypothetical protein
MCWAGEIISILLILGFVPRACALILWILYLSLTVVGQDFLGFQWDNLLLESGLLLIFLAPAKLYLADWSTQTPPRLPIYLFWLLLFKLMFLSGVVKLASQDPTWRSLSALDVHFFSQPLPNIFSWFAQAAPEFLKKAAIAVMFFIEIAVPFAIFFGAHGRKFAAIAFVFLQMMIALTGNYGFFNLLTAVLCLSLFIPTAVKDTRPQYFTRAFTVFYTTICLIQFTNPFLNLRTLSPVQTMLSTISPLRSINPYGLFATMTTKRFEIIFEGSNDGTTWLPYELPFKPGDPVQAPPIVIGHMPRLDWQLWFAALDDDRPQPWVIHLASHILHGTPEVLGLFAKNPFPDQPPLYLRAEFYDYRFTTPSERESTGEWWHRDLYREYLPTVSLRK